MNAAWSVMTYQKYPVSLEIGVPKKCDAMCICKGA